MRLLLIDTKFLVLFVCLIFNKTKAQTELPLTYSPDGVVNSIISKGDTLIVGGNFNHVGKYTGGGALFSNVSDQPDLSFPKINGVILASSPDGNGGFYVYGTYYRESESPNQSSSRLEHILANNTFEVGFSISINTSRVNHILFHQGILYIGTTFDTQISGQVVGRLSAINVITKQIVSWIPSVTVTSGNPEITRIFANGNSLYIIGNFHQVGGIARQNAASIQIGLGTIKAWNPSPNWNASLIVYNDLLFYKNQIIIGGTFNDGGGPGNMKHACASVDTLTGQTFRYLFVSGGLFGNNGGYLYHGASVKRLALKGDVLFAYSIGTFDTRVTALDLNAVNVSNPNIPYASGVLWMKYFNMIASPADMAVIGNSLFLLGSNFDEVYVTNKTNSSAADIERKIKGGVKLNVTNGALENWFPDPVGWNVNDVKTMSVSGNKIFAGGVFSHVNGMDRIGVYMMNTQTETILPFKLNFAYGYPTTEVHTLKLMGDNLYVGGELSWLSFRDYPVLGFNVNTGTILNWYPPKLGTVYTLEANNDFVFVGGSLTEPAGGAGRQKLFAISRTTGTLNNWAPNPSSDVKTLHLANDQLYVGGSFTTISGQIRNRAASYTTSNLSLTNWNPNTNSDVNSIYLKSGSIWLGGIFSTVGGLTRNLVAGVDPITGLNNINSNASFYGWPINTINSKACKLFLGGAFQADNTNLCNKLAVFDLSTNTLLPSNSFCFKIEGGSNAILSSAMVGNDLFFAGGFEKINSNTKSTNIGRIRFPANYFVPCTISNCGTAVALSSTVDDYNTGQYLQKTNLGISATNKVTGTSQVTLQSNSSVLLLPNSNDGKGFTAKPNSGGYFKAQIGGCP